MKTALVLGGAGFIGSHLLRELNDSGEYSQLISGDVRPPAFKVDNVDYRTIDVREELNLDDVENIDEIYNFAAIHTTPGHEDWEYFWTNVLGATNVCRFAAKINCNHIIFTSSIAVYGPDEEKKVETTPVQPISAYGRSKYSAEQIHHNWRQESTEQRKLIIIRPAIIYGYKEGGNYSRLASALKKGIFFYAGRKDTIKASGYVKDLVRSIRFVMAKNQQTITYNFAHAKPLTIEETCEAFCQAAPLKRPILLPLFVLMPAAFGFEILNAIGLKNSINRARIMKLYKSTNIIPEKLDQLGFEYKYSVIDSLLDWQKEDKNFR